MCACACACACVLVMSLQLRKQSEESLGRSSTGTLGRAMGGPATRKSTTQAKGNRNAPPVATDEDDDFDAFLESMKSSLSKTAL